MLTGCLVAGESYLDPHDSGPSLCHRVVLRHVKVYFLVEPVNGSMSKVRIGISCTTERPNTARVDDDVNGVVEMAGRALHGTAPVDEDLHRVLESRYHAVFEVETLLEVMYVPYHNLRGAALGLWEARYQTGQRSGGVNLPLLPRAPLAACAHTEPSHARAHIQRPARAGSSRGEQQGQMRNRRKQRRHEKNHGCEVEE